MTEEQKELLKQEMQLLEFVCFMTGLMLNSIGEIELIKNTLKTKKKIKNKLRYKHDIAKYGNNFFDELLKVDAMAIKLREGEVNGYENLHNSYLAIENIVNCMMNLKNDSQREYLNKELEEVFNKFNLID